MSYIRVKHIWTDDDGMVQIEIQASNGTQVAEQDFYAYPEAIIHFCKELAEFPFIKDSRACLEYGAAPNYYCHFCLSAVMLNNQGHSAFELRFNNRLAPPLKAEGVFYMACEAVTINTFSQRLLHWLQNQETVLLFEWGNT
jgi:hypothetical protein